MTLFAQVITSTPVASTGQTAASISTPEVTATSWPTQTLTPRPQGPSGKVLYLKNGIPSDYWAAHSTDRQLWMRDLDTGDDTQLTDQPGTAIIDSSTNPPTLRVIAVSKPDFDLVPVAFTPLPAGCPPEPEICAGFHFSPDGRLLGYAALVDPNGAMKGTGFEARVVDATTGEEVFSTQGGFGGWLDNDSIRVTNWHSEAAGIAKVDIPSGKRTYLGEIGGGFLWSPDRRAFAQVTVPYIGFEKDFWVYDLDTENRYVPLINGEHEIGHISAPGNGIYDHLCWTPDGSALVYDWQRITHVPGPDNLSAGTLQSGPQQVLLIDRAQQERQLLADPSTRYRVAKGCQWRGDVVQVLKGPFTAVETIDDTFQNDGTAISCGPGSADCKQSQSIGLNWRTGEVSEWIDMTATPTPDPKKPDLNTPPIYSDPAGGYGLYTRADGTGLWYVPAQGEPIQLVFEGPVLYIPPRP